ncbi:MAG: RIP metalloprotease RseP [Neisseriaceae bacterium]|nr:RIP metalloprotease RseP [Neisseriaceae bacterium]
MTTLLAFLVAIVVLVSLHELGHYLVARWCGVRVTRFSVGFGTPFFMRKKGHTEWALAPIPLGGYVRMLDTREGNVSEEDRPFAFDQQHPLKKMAIVLAGPIANLILAVLFFSISNVMGVTDIKAMVGTVQPASLAAKAQFQSGDHIQSINGVAVADWQDAQKKIMLGLDDGDLSVAVVDAQGQPHTRVIKVADDAAAVDQAIQNGVGLMAYRITTVLGSVAPQSAAEAAGLMKGDKLLSINEKEVANWFDWVNIIQDSPGKQLTITYERAGARHSAQLRPASQDVNGTLMGFAGVSPSSDEAWAAQISHSWYPGYVKSIKMAAEQVWEYVVLTVQFFGKLVTGQASLKHIGGPVMIADVAGKSAAMGLQPYLEFLALISVSLGVLNLLPIPVLDGGHFVFHTIEWLRGKPLSDKAQAFSMRIGVFAMLLLMMVAFFNDFSRFFG